MGMDKQQKLSAAILMIVAIAGMGVIGWNVIQNDAGSDPKITNFAECVAAGNPISESYPEQCSDGSKTYVNTHDATVPAEAPPTDTAL
jgi:hypothetical protein